MQKYNFFLYHQHIIVRKIFLRKKWWKGRLFHHVYRWKKRCGLIHFFWVLWFDSGVPPARRLSCIIVYPTLRNFVACEGLIGCCASGTQRMRVSPRTLHMCYHARVDVVSSTPCVSCAPRKFGCEQCGVCDVRCGECREVWWCVMLCIQCAVWCALYAMAESVLQARYSINPSQAR